MRRQGQKGRGDELERIINFSYRSSLALHASTAQHHTAAAISVLCALPSNVADLSALVALPAAVAAAAAAAFVVVVDLKKHN